MHVREMPQVFVRLNPELHAWVKSECERQARSQNWFLVNLVQQAKSKADANARRRVASNKPSGAGR